MPGWRFLKWLPLIRHCVNTNEPYRKTSHAGEPGPISVQILGTDPKQMADAACFNVDRGAQIIDINMGCPAKKVCSVAAGSALLKNEPLVQNILRSVIKAVDCPVTLKIRTGWDMNNRKCYTNCKNCGTGRYFCINHSRPHPSLWIQEHR